MPVRLLDTLPLRRRLRRQPRCSGANAADRVQAIGEQVESLRNLCTGRRPVHFFHKSGVALAALIAVAIPASPALADSNAATVAAATQPIPAGQSIADFYKQRNGYPLWLAPRSGDSAQQ